MMTRVLIKRSSTIFRRSNRSG